MAKHLRVYELGRHYGVDSKQIKVLLDKMGVEAKSHMSIVEEDVVDRVHAVFTRKRDLARENYAKAHGLDPEKLKHVAALKALERPQPEEEPVKTPAKKKKATKKKKKAPAKPKVVVIKKAGTKTQVSKAAQAKKDEEDRLASVEKQRQADEKKKREDDLAAKRAEHAGVRIVKKADIVKSDEETPENEIAAVPVDVEAVVEEQVEAVAEEVAEVVEVVDPVKNEASPKTEEVKEPASAPVVEPTVDEVPEVKEEQPAPIKEETEAETSPEAVVPVTEEPKKATKGKPAAAGKVDPLDKVGTKKQDGFKVGDVIRAAPKRPVGKPKPFVDGGAIKDSVKEAIERRKTEAADRDVVSSRKKRTRKKKKKVDQAEVDRALKQTMAQMDGGKGKKRRKKGSGGVAEVPADEQVVVETAVLKLTEFITVQELAEKLNVKAQELIGKLFAMGMMCTINQRLEKENIELLVADFDREVEFLSEYGEEILEVGEVKDEDLVDRPPVVTVMGHVDHGKTSLLDNIRKTNVIAGESGGITQHIGAYTVDTDGGPITFLDTPGHAAFTAMRARGAQVTDIVILIVAADDRVMPQTVEAISHAKAAKVPIIVAVNKIDLPGARPDLVKQELLQHEIMVEDFGGDVLCAEVSAKQGLGIEKLLELVHLQAEVLELKASDKGPARGSIVEARKEPGRGVVFTVLIDQGTLSVGDNFLVGMQDGKVRAMTDEYGNSLQKVHPGEPVEVMGGNAVPQAGDRFYVLESEREARELAAKRRSLQRQQELIGPKVVIDLDNLADLMTAGTLKELPIIIKGDVAGSVEALADQFMDLNTEEVGVKIMHKAVGAISEADVMLAANSGAMIIGFHLRPGPSIRDLAKANNVTIEVFDIIYEAVDTLRKAMTGLLGSIEREVSIGKAEVRQVFRIPKVGAVAGSMVVDGIMKRNIKVRIIRDEVVVYEGKVNSLRRFKDDVKEVKTGYECGIGLENFYDIFEGDAIEAFEIEEVKRTEL